MYHIVATIVKFIHSFDFEKCG